MTTPSTEQRQREQGQHSASETASRVSLAISLLVLSVVVGLVVYTYVAGGDQPSTITVEPHYDELRLANGQYYLPLTIDNVGGETAEALLVQLTHTPPSGEPHTAEFTIDFLAGGENTEAVATFNSDPREGTLEPAYSFLRP